MNSNLVPAGIVGIGSYLPEKVLTNADLEKMVETNDEWITTRTGIKERRIADEGSATSDLAIEAARRALDDAGVKPEEIDLIVLSTATPDMFFPATACIVQEKLGCVNAAGFDLLAGCSGFVYALSVGSQFINTGLYKNVLVIGSDTLSRITDWQDRATCVLFGDGAGAAVLQPVEKGQGILAIELGANGQYGDVLYMPGGGSRIPATNESVDAREHYIKMSGQGLFKIAVKVMGDAATKALENAGIKQDEIDWLVPHQANYRIIEAAAKRLGLDMDKVYVNLDKYGNTSTATIPIALDEAVKSGKIKKGDNVVLVGFGAGLTWAASVMKWCK